MSQSRATQLSVPVNQHDHVDGVVDATVTLVEYGDYECPYCEEAHQAVKELRRTLNERVRFVFRHFPLTQLHPHAQRAAEAAEAAAEQGKFWEMHDLLFEHPSEIREAELQDFAATLDLDLTQFNDELAMHTHRSRVREDIISGAQSGVIGTPTFFINGERYDEQWDVAPLRTALEDAM
ncbi:DsbA family protein [Haladaptatus pallidirubidus]|uniref:DsbA family protein n=1 Tax=Haladaptatus pallidirubidus TaxID=1008152 RepID=A0AAV3UFG3_9EURY|nr:DsbA family protein [Haladaptatus pallidirubidus]